MNISLNRTNPGVYHSGLARNGAIRNGVAGLCARATCIALASVTSIAFAAETPNRRENFTEKYALLAEHNIFLKDRTVKPSKASTQPSAAVLRQPEESLVFRGAVLDPAGGGVRAYIEDLTNGTMLQLAPGDAVARGRIAEIGIDAILYERNGEQVTIQMGTDLTGKVIFAVVGDSSGPTTGPVEIIDPNRTDLTMEEKLKLRRQLEKSK